MRLERAWVRALLVFALGLAAISGLSVVLEVLGMSRSFIQFMVLAAFLGTVGLAVGAALQRHQVYLKGTDGFESA